MNIIKFSLMIIIINLTTLLVKEGWTMEMIGNKQESFHFDDYDNVKEIQNELLKRYPVGNNVDNLKDFLLDVGAIYIGEGEINQEKNIKNLNILFSEKYRENNTEYYKQLSKIQQKIEGKVCFFRYSKTSNLGTVSKGWLVKIFLNNDRQIKNIEVSKELTGI